MARSRSSYLSIKPEGSAFSHFLTTLFLLSSPSLLPALDVSLVLSVPHLPLSHCLFFKDCCLVDYVYNKDMNQ